MKYKDIADAYLAWSESAYKANLQEDERNWCWLGFDKWLVDNDKQLSEESIREYFEFEDLNEEYKKINESTAAQPKNTSYIKAEIGLIQGAKRSFVARHKSRLANYANDAIQKHYNQRTAISFGVGRFLVKKEQAEQKK